jgi:dTDP-glucose 4,6-dehydratase
MHPTKSSFSETDPMLDILEYHNPGEAYAAAKIRSERMFQESLSSLNIDYVVARGFSFVGPYLPIDTNFAIGNFINDVLHDRDILIKGDGSSLRTYLYSADLIIWILKLVTQGRSGEAYNLGAEKAYSIRKLAEAVLKFSDSRKARLIIQDDKEHYPSSRYLPSIQKVKSELGLDAWHDLEEALARTIRWHRLKG